MTRVVASERNVLKTCFDDHYTVKKKHILHILFLHFYQSNKRRELARAAKGPDVFLLRRQRPELG